MIDKLLKPLNDMRCRPTEVTAVNARVVRMSAFNNTERHGLPSAPCGCWSRLLQWPQVWFSCGTAFLCAPEWNSASTPEMVDEALRGGDDLAFIHAR